jgi:hypothetical protein
MVLEQEMIMALTAMTQCIRSTAASRSTNQDPQGANFIDMQLTLSYFTLIFKVNLVIWMR